MGRALQHGYGASLITLTGILHMRRNGCGFDGFLFFMLDIHTHTAAE